MKRPTSIFLWLCALLFFSSTSSYLYNFPIPFWKTAPGSQDVAYDAGAMPDNIVLTPAADMSTMISITWRTAASVPSGVVQFFPNGASSGGTYQQAARAYLYSRELKSGNRVACYSATLSGLAPGTTYRYRVGNVQKNAWSDFRTFTTAPAGSSTPFSFIYFGSPQTDPKAFGAMLETLEKRHPETAFYMAGGNMVAHSEQRNLWDGLLLHAGSVFSRKPVAPAMEPYPILADRTGEKTFSAYFTLPLRKSQHAKTPKGYGFAYGGAYFIVINAQASDMDTPSAWLEEELKQIKSSVYSPKILMLRTSPTSVARGVRPTSPPETRAARMPVTGVDVVLSGRMQRGGAIALPGTAAPFSPEQPDAASSSAAQQTRRAAAKRKGPELSTYARISVTSSPPAAFLVRYELRDADGQLLESAVLQTRE